jgi:hypothetical protein
MGQFFSQLVPGVLLALGALHGVTPAMADIRGNGGDVVVCRDNASRIASIELLDFYEGRFRYGLEPDLSAGETWLEKLEHTLARLARVDPELAKGFKAEVESFAENALFWPGIQLVDIPDSGHIAIPHGCEIVQIAVQKDPQFPDEKRYTISQDLWDDPAMSEASRAGLVLHEIIYRRALAAGQSDSVKTRYLTSYINSRRFVPEAVGTYFDILGRTGFGLPKIFGFRGLFFHNLFDTDREFHPNGWPKSLRLAVDGTWTLQTGEVLHLGRANGEQIWVGFHPSGLLAKSGRLFSPTEFQLQHGPILVEGAEFDDQERLIRASIDIVPGTDVELPTSPGFKVYRSLYIHEGQYVIGGPGRTDQIVRICGEDLLAGKEQVVLFDPTLTYVTYAGGFNSSNGRSNPLCFRNPESGNLQKVNLTGGGSFEFSPEGQVMELYSRDGIMVRVSQKDVKLGDYIVFHPNGYPASGVLAEQSAQLFDQNGVLQTYWLGNRLKFSEQGLVISRQ